MNIYGWHTLITPFHLNDKLPPQAEGAQFNRTLKKWWSVFMAHWIKCRRKRTGVTILISEAEVKNGIPCSWVQFQRIVIVTFKCKIKKNTVGSFDVLYWFETWLLSVKEELWRYGVGEVLKWGGNKQMERIRPLGLYIFCCQPKWFQVDRPFEELFLYSLWYKTAGWIRIKLL